MQLLGSVYSAKNKIKIKPDALEALSLDSIRSFNWTTVSQIGQVRSYI